MANAADYLILDTTQLTTTYKLRTRSISARTFTATNIAPNYRLSVNVRSGLDGVSVTPSSFELDPKTTITIQVNFDTAILETLTAGTLAGALNFTVAAAPIIIPEIPTSPPPAPLPPAPRQIISRIEITPSNFTLSELGEAKQYNAVLYVDDAPVQGATFRWTLDENLAEGLSISANGTVRSLKRGINRAVVVASCTSPIQYVGTVGLSNAATNIPLIVNTNPTVPPPPVTGNLTVTIRGIPNSIGGNVDISGLNQRITQTTTFNNIAAGTYTITPTVVTSGNENYNPTGGGQVHVEAGTTREIVVEYALQPVPDVNTISILEILGPNGRLNPGATLFVGDRFNVVVQTYRNGQAANLGDVQINATNTSQGVQTATRQDVGKASATFTISEPGLITISAIGAGGKSVTGNLNAARRATYTIRVSRPQTLINGQCTPITATVLRDGVETNIPVSIELTNNLGLISDTPCEVRQIQTDTPTTGVTETNAPVLRPFIPEPTATGTSNATGQIVGATFTPIVDRSTTTSRTLNEAELRTGGNTIRDNVVFVDQGENAI